MEDNYVFISNEKFEEMADYHYIVEVPTRSKSEASALFFVIKSDMPNISLFTQAIRDIDDKHVEKIISYCKGHNLKIYPICMEKDHKLSQTLRDGMIVMLNKHGVLMEFEDIKPCVDFFLKTTDPALYEED